MYLLDTNHCSLVLRGHPGSAEHLSLLGQARVATCVIVAGELTFMAAKSERRADNLTLVRSFLQTIAVYSVDRDTADIYGILKGAVVDLFGPRDRARRRQFDVTKLGISDNDLWIAATAKRHGMTLVSSDQDLVRISQVEPISIESWWV